MDFMQFLLKIQEHIYSCSYEEELTSLLENKTLHRRTSACRPIIENAPKTD
jgi:hypothetical protein